MLRPVTSPRREPSRAKPVFVGDWPTRMDQLEQANVALDGVIDQIQCWWAAATVRDEGCGDADDSNEEYRKGGDRSGAQGTPVCIATEQQPQPPPHLSWAQQQQQQELKRWELEGISRRCSDTNGMAQTAKTGSNRMRAIEAPEHATRTCETNDRGRRRARERDVRRSQHGVGREADARARLQHRLRRAGAETSEAAAEAADVAIPVELGGADRPAHRVDALAPGEREKWRSFVGVSPEGGQFSADDSGKVTMWARANPSDERVLELDDPNIYCCQRDGLSRV